MGATPIDFSTPAPGANGSPYSRHKATEQEEEATPITLLDGPAIAAPIPELDYLVREIGQVAGGGAPDLVAGYGFTGKTIAGQSKLVSLAVGRAVWGAYSCGPARRVLHVDLEQGNRLTRRRYQRLARAMGVDLRELGDMLALAVMPPLSLTDACRSLWRDLMAGRHLMLVDSLRAATGGLDENSSDIRAGLDMLGHLSEETACHVEIIHHARKPTEDGPGGRYAIRGSGAIYDSVDSAYLFSAAKGEPVGVEHVKARSHGELVSDFALVISDVEIDGDPKAGLRVQVHGAELVAQRRQEQASTTRREQARRDAEVVRRVLAGSPGLGMRELRAAVRPVGRERLESALYDMGNEVEVREERQGRTVTRRHFVRGGPHA